MSWLRVAVYWGAALLLAAVYLLGGGRNPDAGMPRTAPAADRPAASTQIPTPVRLVELERGGALVAWERPEAGGAWRVTSPPGRAIPPGLLEAFVDQLAAVSKGEHFEAGADDPAFGLEHPGLRISVVGEDGRKVELVVGDRTPTGTAAYARSVAGGPVFLVGLNLLYYTDLLFDAAR
jgi:Domain of unknown function (DUF4340)